MTWTLPKRFELLADQSASLSLGCAIGYSAYHLLPPVAGQPTLVAYAVAAAAFAYWAGRSLLRVVGGEVPVVGLGDPQLVNAATVGDSMEAVEPDLAPKIRARPDSDPAVVVRLFDPAQLAASGPSIDRYESLVNGPSGAAFPDASQSLHEALNQLRQSLASRR